MMTGHGIGMKIEMVTKDALKKIGLVQLLISSAPDCPVIEKDSQSVTSEFIDSHGKDSPTSRIDKS